MMPRSKKRVLGVLLTFLIAAVTPGTGGQVMAENAMTGRPPNATVAGCNIEHTFEIGVGAGTCRSGVNSRYSCR